MDRFGRDCWTDCVVKVVVAGIRYTDPVNKIVFTDYDLVASAISGSGYDITQVISGTAIGVDSLGETWAKENNILVKRMPADWNAFGKAAGHIRNKAMAEYCDAAVIVWDWKSKGTKNMINQMIRLEKSYHLVFVDDYTSIMKFV